MIITFCANDAFVLEHIDINEVLENIEEYIYNLPRFYTYFVVFFFLVFEYSIPPISWKFRTFRKYSIEKRLEILKKWANSYVYFKRMIFISIKSVIIAHIYSQKKLLYAIGYGDTIEGRINRKKDDHCYRTNK